MAPETQTHGLSSAALPGQDRELDWEENATREQTGTHVGYWPLRGELYLLHPDFTELYLRNSN